MLTADLDLTNLDSPVGLAGGSIFVGESVVTPYAHRLTRALVVESDDQIAIACLERYPGDPSGIEHVRVAGDDGARHVDRVRTHLLDWGLLRIARSSGTVSYEASQVHVAPVYLCAGPDRVRIDWDCSRLLTARGSAPVDTEMMMAQLGGCSPYSTRTLVRGMYRSTAGATLIAHNGRVDTRLGSTTRGAVPQPLAAGTSPQDMLFDTLTALLAARDIVPRRLAIEISGGMDSALVALAAAARFGPDLLSYGAQFDGTMGDAQRGRRQLLCAHGGYRDIEFPANRFLPFAPESPRRARFGVWPQDENYPEIFDAIFGVLARAGIDTLASGFGGDELYVAYRGEEPDDDSPFIDNHPFLTAASRPLVERGAASETGGIVAKTSWLSTHGRAQRLLRHGIWPIYPYINPTLARYVSSLPWEYRRDRALLRQTLTARLGNPVFEHDYIKENFGEIAVAGIAGNRDYLRGMVERSHVLAEPLVDRTRILMALDGDIGALPGTTCGLLFNMLTAACFFDDPSKAATSPSQGCASPAD